jgi:hypothetical protein
MNCVLDFGSTPEDAALYCDWRAFLGLP